ncbi:MAG: hypothetical protein HY912_13050 [Desulfomonile tiedjei]|uniref:YkgJ family cysteine cluster protein n=1 Tax=Desulfomonile tiedjei TaxID=2358 RepID=A0A9D6V2P3_9BACT|nr:hypothetical protein [Desulfomonile tiedjei]
MIPLLSGLFIQYPKRPLADSFPFWGEEGSGKKMRWKILEFSMFSGDELIPRLSELYRTIDSTYGAAVHQVGFSCGGCDGVKCCTVDLTLHTFIEMLYLRRGFKTLESSIQLDILHRCRQIVKDKHDDPWGDAYRSAVCAVNFGGLCSLYEYRPMICRLAGVPHFFARPDGSTTQSEGCSRYETEIRSNHPELLMDRTQFYRGMASIELEIVRARGNRAQSRTVAETLVEENLEGWSPDFQVG